MGVDFYICTKCSRTFPDCGEYSLCNEDHGGCGKVFCGTECAALEMPGRDRVLTWQEVEALPEGEFQALKTTCSDCRNENASDENLFYFLLKKLGTTRDDVAKEYLAAATDKRSDAR